MIRNPIKVSLILASAASFIAIAAGTEAVWRNTVEMRRQLQNPVGIDWSSQPLREALKNLSTTERVAIWIDRRIDPSSEPQLSFTSSPLQQVLRDVAKSVRSDVGFVGPIVYIGPPSTAGKLWTIAELRQDDLRRLPADRRSKWSQRRALQWPDLSTPSELLQSIADQSGCKIEGLDAIPHDLWASANLPPLTLSEQLILILAGFDRTFEVSDGGRLIRVIAMPEQPTLQREYDASRSAADLPRRFPNVQVLGIGSKLKVIGTAEEHDDIARFLRGVPEPRPAQGPKKVVYSIKVTNQPIGAILNKIVVLAQLQISIDEKAKEKLGELVSFEVKDVTLEQLLQAATQNTGLKYQLQGQQLHVQLEAFPPLPSSPPDR